MEKSVETIDPGKPVLRPWQHEVWLDLMYNTRVEKSAPIAAGKSFLAAYAAWEFWKAHRNVKVVIVAPTMQHLEYVFADLSCISGLDIHTRDGEVLAVIKAEEHSYLVGIPMTTKPNLLGYTGKYTLFIADEAQSIPESVFQQAATWAQRMLILRSEDTSLPEPIYVARDK